MKKLKAAAAIGESYDKFERHFDLDYAKRDVKKKKEFFIPYEQLTDKYKKFYENELVEEDVESSQVEDVLGDISSGITPLDDVSSDLKEAQLENIKMRTKVLQEKLNARKTELYTEWTERFFDVFSTSFAKLKNELISLHLNDEQIKTLREKIDNSLLVMQDNLDKIYNEWMNENDTEEEMTK